MLEVLGGRAEDKNRQPLALGIAGHVVEPLAHGSDAPEVVMLLQQALDAQNLPRGGYPQANLVQSGVLLFAVKLMRRF
jgi:hypothetical protein